MTSSNPDPSAQADAKVDFHDLLVKTSRTFALSIPVLPEPTRHQVTLAYLLFRIADTFEDAVHWRKGEQIEALHLFADHLRNPGTDGLRRATERWVEARPIEHEGYLELLAATPEVVEELFALDEDARDAIIRHTLRTALGMAEFVSRTEEGRLELEDLSALRGYCYVVAGIVGEMLTELFILGDESLEGIAPFLSARAATFGEALQLVNILKDSSFDAGEGRFYLPAKVRRSEIFALAREDLETAGEYIRKMQGAGADRGYLEFTALPVRLAWATLRRVEEHGAGSKVSREEVAGILRALHDDLDADRPAV